MDGLRVGGHLSAGHLVPHLFSSIPILFDPKATFSNFTFWEDHYYPTNSEMQKEKEREGKEKKGQKEKHL